MRRESIRNVLFQPFAGNDAPSLQSARNAAEQSVAQPRNHQSYDRPPRSVGALRLRIRAVILLSADKHRPHSVLRGTHLRHGHRLRPQSNHNHKHATVGSFRGLLRSAANRQWALPLQRTRQKRGSELRIQALSTVGRTAFGADCCKPHSDRCDFGVGLFDSYSKAGEERDSLSPQFPIRLFDDNVSGLLLQSNYCS